MLLNVSLELHLYTIYICVIYQYQYKKKTKQCIHLFCISNTFLECCVQLSGIHEYELTNTLV